MSYLYSEHAKQRNWPKNEVKNRAGKQMLTNLELKTQTGPNFGEENGMKTQKIKNKDKLKKPWDWADLQTVSYEEKTSNKIK